MSDPVCTTSINFVLSGDTAENFRGRFTLPPLGAGILAAGAAFALRRSVPLAAAVGVGTSGVSVVVTMRYFNRMSLVEHLQRLDAPGQASTRDEYKTRVRNLGRVECTLNHEVAGILSNQSTNRVDFGDRQVPHQFSIDFPRMTVEVDGAVKKDPQAFADAVERLCSGSFDDTVQTLSQGAAFALNALVNGLFMGQQNQVVCLAVDGGPKLERYGMDIVAGEVVYTYRARWLLMKNPEKPSRITVDSEVRIVRGQPSCQITLFPPVRRELDQLLAGSLQAS